MREVDLKIDLNRNFDRRTGINRSSEGFTRSAKLSRGIGRTLSGWIKRGLDFVLASLGLILLSPMIAMVVVVLLVAQGRPIFISQKRIGKDGVLFPCLKFRSMVNNASEALALHLASNPHLRAEWNATRKLQDDPRVTPLGRFLRKSSVDEIPQLLNVLCGQMSLVGPRPIVAGEVELYGPHFGHYTMVRPGMTGLWQISGRSDTSYGTRVDLDVQYVSERSTWGDIVIMLKTIPAVLQTRGSY
ncbi:sugar transferase [Rhizobium sp. 16-449-1b]|uniref:sugar transferase n=1 Tax=Rhizobium sp. 16-449-1b TaxID=2819989 RepID=UPI0009DDFC53|nr:sugar transferase [Rhizobium sp. 16-449-1b]MBO9196852.1 sugar transferase [Rhizobium sp. 16-449-1b]